MKEFTKTIILLNLLISFRPYNDLSRMSRKTALKFDILLISIPVHDNLETLKKSSVA